MKSVFSVLCSSDLPSFHGGLVIQPRILAKHHGKEMSANKDIWEKGQVAWMLWTGQSKSEGGAHQISQGIGGCLSLALWQLVWRPEQSLPPLSPHTTSVHTPGRGGCFVFINCRKRKAFAWGGTGKRKECVGTFPQWVLQFGIWWKRW